MDKIDVFPLLKIEFAVKLFSLNSKILTLCNTIASYLSS